MTEQSLPKVDWRVVFNRAVPPGSHGWGRVRAAQLVEMSRAMVIAGWGQTINALIVVYMLWGQAPPMQVAGWLVSLALLLHFFAGAKARLASRQIHSLPRPTIDKAAYHSVFFAVVWAFPARYFFEFANHGQQLALCVITATMMGGAAFILSPVPAAAAAYVILMGVAVTRMLLTTDSLVIAAIGPPHLVQPALVRGAHDQVAVAVALARVALFAFDRAAFHDRHRRGIAVRLIEVAIRREALLGRARIGLEHRQREVHLEARLGVVVRHEVIDALLRAHAAQVETERKHDPRTAVFAPHEEADAVLGRFGEPAGVEHHLPV